MSVNDLPGISYSREGTLASLLESCVTKAPDRIAFIDGSERVTYADFGILCGQAVTWLRQQGIGPGDRVAVWMVNRIEWLALYFGLAHIGAVLVSVNTRFRSDEVTHILGKSGASVLVFQPSFKKIDFSAILRDVDSEKLPLLKKLALMGNAGDSSESRGWPTVPVTLTGLDGAIGTCNADPDAPSILFTTSGTTKGPKLVIHTQRTMEGHARRCATSLGMDQPNSVMLAMLPFCGVFGINGVLAAFAGGATVVLMDSFDGPIAAHLLRQHKVTHTFGSDEMYRRLIDATQEEIPFPHARLFGFGAFASAFNEYAIEAWKREIPLTGLYGSSEVLALWSAQPKNLPVEQRIEGGGIPIAGAEATVRIRDVESGRILTVGLSGEIEIHGPSNFAGYYNDSEATAQAMCPDGFFRTGDLGYLRGDGSLVFQTRMGDAIRLGGFLVDPVEIEEVLKQLPGVADAQVVGVQIEGQLRPVAFIIEAHDSRVQIEALKSTIASRVAPFKVPARIWTVPGFPMTQSANGMKTQRVKLREWATERLACEAGSVESP